MPATNGLIAAYVFAIELTPFEQRVFGSPMASLHLTLTTNIPDQQICSFRFNESGGSVGRSQDCDWRLNDVERFISNKHIIISFVNDHFLVTDTSSNGTFINQNSQALGKGNSHHLKLNDIIKVGSFLIQVSEIDLLPPQVIHIPTTPKPSFENASENMSATDSDLLDLVSGKKPSFNTIDKVDTTHRTESSNADSLGLFDILSGDTSNSDSNSDSSPFANSNLTQSAMVPTADKAQASPFLSPGTDNTIPDNWDLDDEQPAAETSPVKTVSTFQDNQQLNTNAVAPYKNVEEQAGNRSTVTTEPTPPVIPESLSDSSKNDSPSAPKSEAVETTNIEDDFFSLLYQKLELPHEYMNSVNKAEFANDLVQILMTSTQGLMALLAGRSALKQESRLSMTMIKPQSNNPIKFSLDPSDTLEMLLVKKKSGYLSAQAAYAEVMHDLQLHQMAFLSGLQASMEGILSELSPDKIEQEAAQKSRDLMDFKGHSRKWDCFTQKQQHLNKQIKENLNDILARHFSASYENYINNAEIDN